MKINNVNSVVSDTTVKTGTNSPNQANQTIDARLGKNASAERMQAETKAQETVKISGLAIEMQKKIKAAEEGNPVREQRIAEIKEQIKLGQFKVDSSAIADKLISSTVSRLLAE